MANSSLQFQIHAIPTAIVVILAPLFIGLGVWQLDRAEQKRNIATSLEMRRKLPLLPFSNHLPEARQLQFRKITAAGRFLADKTVLIENRKYRGKSGFHVITPLRTDSGEVVLVNRGWIPGQGEALPADIPSVQAEVIIEGEVSIPLPPALELKLNLEQTDATPHWPYLTLGNYSSWSGLEIQPFLILQAADDASGLIRRWPRPQVDDAMHIGYAIQWFAFALIVVAIWLRLSITRRSTTGDDE